MKIVLRAFQGKMSGVMEVPEETGPRFRLAMTQPVQFTMFDSSKHPMMPSPLNVIANFEWTGGTFSQKGHDWDKAREYQLISFDNL